MSIRVPRIPKSRSLVPFGYKFPSRKGRYSLKKAPKRPKRNASVEVKERYLVRLAEIKRANKEILKMIQRSRELDAAISQAIRDLNKI